MDTYEELLRNLRDGLDDGEVIGKSRVIDHLLDLRLAAGADPVRHEAIDKALADAPGKNMVPVQWWAERLMDLGLDSEREVVG